MTKFDYSLSNSSDDDNDDKKKQGAMIEKMRIQFNHMLKQKLSAIEEEICDEDGGGFFSEL
jgi:hypothetical protein